MKMIIGIIRDEDSEPVIQALVDKGYRVTRIASTGGFLRRGMTTLIIGVEDEQVDDAIATVGDNCSSTIEPTIRRATLFVLNVEKFTQI